MHGRGRGKTGEARELRQRATPAERRLWTLLRTRHLSGFKFRRQAPLWGFVADFYCPEVGLVLELDGGVHTTAQQAAYDSERDACLAGRGLHVVRIPNQDLFDSPEAVCATILKIIQARQNPPQA